MMHRGERVWGRSHEEQARGTITKALSPVDCFPTGSASLAEDVPLVPDVFHSGSRLEEVPKVTVTPEPPAEVLTLN